MTIVIIVLIGTFLPLTIMSAMYSCRAPLTAYYEDGSKVDIIDYSKRLHRLSGPALIIGKKKEYWICGTRVSEERYEAISNSSKEQLAIFLVSPRSEERILAEYYLRRNYG